MGGVISYDLRATLSDLLVLVHEQNGNLPTPNNPDTLDYFTVCAIVLPLGL